MTAAIRGQEYPFIHAVLIERNGFLVYEEYFEGEDVRRGRGPLGRVVFDAHTLHDIRSVTKSVMSALVGVALHAGLLSSLDQPLLDLLPEYAGVAAPDTRRITLRHALTMTAGLEWHEAASYSDASNDEIRMNRSPDPIRFVLSRPVVAEAGTQFNYNGGLTQLLAAAVQRAAGRPLLDYAKAVLFEPLGIGDVEWVDDGHDVPSAASGLRLRPADLAKFGFLCGAGGRWRGRQIIPASWIVDSTRWHTALPGAAPSDWENGYGLHWWHDRWQSPRGWITIVSARGNGGQRIYVLPDYRVVATILAGAYNLPQHQGVADDLFEQRILPALK
jgi:CubicO group peptidase (beta-lactamase class C family)